MDPCIHNLALDGDKWSTLHPGESCRYPLKRSWMSPSGGLDTLEEGNIYFSRCDLYHESSAVLLSGEKHKL